mmetsp:Transcript_44019/g.86893  ORF Transcript_44019/g.86893 Transcript_44019/m.86893 type:complete len:150 (+) Transcript_44019:138-587(+)
MPRVRSAHHVCEHTHTRLSKNAAVHDSSTAPESTHARAGAKDKSAHSAILVFSLTLCYPSQPFLTPLSSRSPSVEQLMDHRRHECHPMSPRPFLAVPLLCIIARSSHVDQAEEAERRKEEAGKTRGKKRAVIAPSSPSTSVHLDHACSL